MLKVDIARYLTYIEDLEFKISFSPDESLLAGLQEKLELYRRIAARLTNMNKEINEGTFMLVHECPRCRNEEHGPGANYCRICGLKINRGEEMITKIDAAAQEISRARIGMISSNFKARNGSNCT